MKTQHLEGATFDHLAKKRFCEKYFLGLSTVKFSNNGDIRITKLEPNINISESLQKLLGDNYDCS